MTVLEVLSLIAGILGLVVGGIGYFSARSAGRKAEESLAQSEEALARTARTADVAAGALGRAKESAEVAQSADRKAEHAQAQSSEALARSTAAVRQSAVAAGQADETYGSGGPADFGARWECEQVKGGIFVARNAGSSVARGALLSDATRPPKYIRPDEVIPRDVHPGDHLQFRAFADASVRSPRVRLTWTEAGDDTVRTQELTIILR